MYVVVLERVYLLQVAVDLVSNANFPRRRVESLGLQFLVRPLSLFYHVKRRVNNELVHVLALLSELRGAISAAL